MKTVEDYLSTFEGTILERMKEVRALIRSLAPEAEESISYGMPAYKLHGKPLVYFAGYKHHLGFYATPTGHEAFNEALSKYKQGKGSVQFPNDQALPVELIKQIILFRIEENSARLSE
jgi:uncharacterized protein YdhG (YjbR/CyaY superfamily)